MAPGGYVGIGVGALKGVSTGLQFGADLMSAYSYDLQASGALISGQLSQWNYNNQADAYAADASGYAAQAGDMQKAGMDQSYLRFNQLAYDIGRIRTKAAGSGIDLSSDIAARVEGQTRTNATYDVNAIQSTAGANASGAMNMAKNSMISSAYATAQGKIEMYGAEATAAANRASAKAAKNIAWANMIGGMSNAVASGAVTGMALS